MTCIKCLRDLPNRNFLRLELLYSKNAPTCKFCFKSTTSCTELSTKRTKRNSDKKLKSRLLGSYTRLKAGAKHRNIDFNLTVSEYLSLQEDQCHYCGKFQQPIGLDRVDNDLGYNIWNVVACCERCNRMKLTYTVKEFIDHCALIGGIK